MLGLDPKWAYNVIKGVGNYAEMFNRNVGPDTPIGLSRGPNKLWTEGGLLLLAAVPVTVRSGPIGQFLRAGGPNAADEFPSPS